MDTAVSQTNHPPRFRQHGPRRVSCKDERSVFLRQMAADDLPVFAHAAGIHMFERLVHHQHRCVGGQRAGDRQPRLFAGRKRVGRLSQRCVRSKSSSQRLVAQASRLCVSGAAVSEIRRRDACATTAMCSNTVRCGHKPPSAGAQNNGIRCDPLLNSAMSFPASAVPKPTSRFSNEVLPAPECPSTAVTPGSIRSVMSRNRRPQSDALKLPQKIVHGGAHQRRVPNASRKTNIGAANAAHVIADNAAIWP